jgi:hypothetical protein
VRRLALFVAVLENAGCQVVEVNAPPLWKAPVVERWLLTERAYGAIADPWTSAGDGVIPAESEALLFEPVFRARIRTSASPIIPGWSPCLHRIRMKRETPEGMGVGETAVIFLDIESNPGTAHGIRIEGVHQGIEIKEIRGARPLIGTPAAYAVIGSARIEVRFTSKIAGRGGLEVELLGEVASSAAPAPAGSLARRR